MFNKDYYERLKKEYGYQPLSELKPLEFGVFDEKTLRILRKKFALHYNFERWLFNLDNERSIITTGIGLSGPPHIGTIYQIMNAVFFQKLGYKVQFVLGDLDSYNSRNKDLNYVRLLAKKYRSFIKALGFDDENGILRTQYEVFGPLRSMYLLVKYTSDKEVIESLEDTKYIYIKEGIFEPSLGLKFSILLMIGDFLDLYLSDDFTNVAVTLGIDEHKYVKLTEKIANRWNLPIKIHGIYSWMIRGFYGYPKMSKSIPKSAITAEMSYEEIRKKLIEGEPIRIKSPFYESPAYQMMCSVSYYSDEELEELYKMCRKGGVEWKKKKIEYLDTHLMPILEKWKN